jgi:hypothetical protein
MNSLVKAALLNGRKVTEDSIEDSTTQAAIMILEGKFDECIKLLESHQDFYSLILSGKAKFCLGNLHEAT